MFIVAVLRKVAEVGVGNVSGARVVVRWCPYSSDIVWEILEWL